MSEPAESPYHHCPLRHGPAGADTWITSASWPGAVTCSFCGSLSADAFFAAIEAGDQLIPTDKHDLVYVGAARKFYFQHFGDGHREKFIALHNETKLRLAHPGYFYVTPYFCLVVADP